MALRPIDMDLSLRERLAWKASREEPAGAAADRAAMARAATYLYAAGGTLALISLALPKIPEANAQGILALLAAAYAVAALLLMAFDRLPLWAFHAALALGTLLVTGAIYFSGEGSSAYAGFYLWVAVYAFYFFSRRAALVQMLLVGVSYAIVLAAREPSAPLARWFLTVGSLLVAGFVIQVLRERVEQMITRMIETTGTDALTGLVNRRGFEERLEAELARAQRSGKPLAVILADADGFKAVNERGGYRTGDMVLQRITEALVKGKRQVDTAARVGGEEFALIAPEADEHGAYMLAERVRSRVNATLGSDDFGLTMSFGIAVHPTHARPAEELLTAASQAVQAAKKLGRDRSVLYSREVSGVLAAREGEEAVGDELHTATVLVLAEALDIRDSGTARHSQTVGRLAELMARELGLPAPRVRRVRLAGILHDVGKISVSDLILRKPGPLDDGEWIEMRRHPEIGARLLASSHFDDVREWILDHHERIDGLGYPRGISADGLAVEARIVAVADAYEAMLNDRCYRPAIGPEAAELELRRCSGTQFDDRVVEALLGALDREGPAILGGERAGTLLPPR
jgi:diguanylate cyclase (GGDEF)-like protein/putative nucleotidyltransferase with HDIG domain